MLKFSIIDHTADVGVAAYGGTLEELFQNAALGMFSVLADPKKVCPAETRTVEVQAESIESLLVQFLGELLYLFEVEHFIVHCVLVEQVSERSVRAFVHGESISPKHEIFTEIKAVTHHELSVEQTGGQWKATVLFDI